MPDLTIIVKGSGFNLLIDGRFFAYQPWQTARTDWALEMIKHLQGSIIVKRPDLEALLEAAQNHLDSCYEDDPELAAALARFQKKGVKDA